MSRLSTFSNPILQMPPSGSFAAYVLQNFQTQFQKGDLVQIHDTNKSEYNMIGTILGVGMDGCLVQVNDHRIVVDFQCLQKYEFENQQKQSTAVGLKIGR